MSSRTVKDVAGRTWTCATEQIDNRGSTLGQDVNIVCTSRSVDQVVRVIVGWQWMRMESAGLAEIVSNACARLTRPRDPDDAAATPI